MEKINPKPDLIHEIKSHLTIIKGYTQLLETSIDNNPKQKDWIQKSLSEINLILEKLESLQSKIGYPIR